MKQEQVKIFESPQFGSIRTSGTSDNPLFCLTDICKVLEVTVQNTKKRLNEKGVYSIYTLTEGGEQQLLFVNEQNLYKVIMRSDKPQAEAFQDWVCGEVLPSIRKTGSYSLAVPSYQIENPIERAKKWIEEQEQSQKALAQADETINAQKVLLQSANEQIGEQQKEITEMKPLVTFANSVLGSKDTCLVRDLAKLFTQNGIKIGQKTMFYVLKRDGYICRGEHSDNMPTQKAVEMGIMEIKETPIFDNKGNSYIKRTPKITQKGCQFLFDKYSKIYNERNQVKQ